MLRRHRQRKGPPDFLALLPTRYEREGYSSSTHCGLRRKGRGKCNSSADTPGSGTPYRSAISNLGITTVGRKRISPGRIVLIGEAGFDTAIRQTSRQRRT